MEKRIDKLYALKKFMLNKESLLSQIGSIDEVIKTAITTGPDIEGDIVDVNKRREDFPEKLSFNAYANFFKGKQYLVLDSTSNFTEDSFRFEYPVSIDMLGTISALINMEFLIGDSAYRSQLEDISERARIFQTITDNDVKFINEVISEFIKDEKITYSGSVSIYDPKKAIREICNAYIDRNISDDDIRYPLSRAKFDKYSIDYGEKREVQGVCDAIRAALKKRAEFVITQLLDGGKDTFFKYNLEDSYDLSDRVDAFMGNLEVGEEVNEEDLRLHLGGDDFDEYMDIKNYSQVKLPSSSILFAKFLSSYDVDFASTKIINSERSEKIMDDISNKKIEAILKYKNIAIDSDGIKQISYACNYLLEDVIPASVKTYISLLSVKNKFISQSSSGLKYYTVISYNSSDILTCSYSNGTDGVKWTSCREPGGAEWDQLLDVASEGGLVAYIVKAESSQMAYPVRNPIGRFLIGHYIGVNVENSGMFSVRDGNEGMKLDSNSIGHLGIDPKDIDVYHLLRLDESYYGDTKGFYEEMLRESCMHFINSFNQTQMSRLGGQEVLFNLVVGGYDTQADDTLMPLQIKV